MHRANRLLIIALMISSLPAWAEKTSQVAANHMRWENHDAVLTHAIAWQEARDGHWVTVVLLTDRAVPPGTLAVGKEPGAVLEETGAQGLSIAIMSGGLPLPESGVDLGFHEGDSIRTTRMNGAGGFEIESQSATRISGRVVFSAFTVGAKDKSAWSVSFDAPVLRGDAKRMAAEGEPLGAGGGQPGKDLLAAQQATLAMDYGALAPYASPELAALLRDVRTRDKNLKMLKNMTAPRARILGGLRNGDKARIYWAQQRPAGLDSRCVDTLVLTDGKWRSVESACQAE
jgi:hypothetical protein